MGDLEFKIRVPATLIERVRNLGFVVDERNEWVVTLLEDAIRRREPPAASEMPRNSEDSSSVLSVSGISTMSGQSEIKRLTAYCRDQLPLATFRLSEEYGYASLPLCVIDAIYSIGVNYESTQNAVKRFCAYVNIPRIKIADMNSLDEYSIPALLMLYHANSAQQLADTVYQNRQRTSARNGILKAEAVRLVAEVLRSFDVNVLADVDKVSGQPNFEYAFKQIPGQGSGVSLRYFYMLTGSVEHIKPDRMIIRFISDALGRNPSVEECHPLLVEVCRELVAELPDLTPRALDNVIWQYQRAKPTAG